MLKPQKLDHASVKVSLILLHGLSTNVDKILPRRKKIKVSSYHIIEEISKAFAKRYWAITGHDAGK